MSKLRLDVEKLVVESFEVADEKRERGTVVGHLERLTAQVGCPQSQICPISDDDPTCLRSCGWLESCPQICTL